MERLIALASLLIVVAAAAAADPAPPIAGEVVFARKGHIWKATLGEKDPADLGEGEFARWSADGERLAIYHRGRVYVADADGANRRLVTDRADTGDGCPIEFHPDGQHVLFHRKKKGFALAEIATGKVIELGLPGQYTGEPTFDATGRKLVARWGQDLYAIDVERREHRKFGKGCSPGVSPDGSLVMQNLGGHRTIAVSRWAGGEREVIKAKGIDPDGTWDNHHWSNHPDWVAAQGDGKRRESYVVHLPTGRGYRVTWGGGRTGYPDLYVRGGEGARGEGREAKREGREASGGGRGAERREAVWPAVTDGLLFAWDHAAAGNDVADASGEVVRTSRLEAGGAARYGRHHELDLAGGTFTADREALGGALAAVEKAGAFTVELTLTPARGDQDAALLTIADGSPGLRIAQRGGTLTWAVGSETGRLGRVTAGRAVHVIVAADGERVQAFANGRRVASETMAAPPRGWAEAEIVLGDGWHGTVEGLAVHAAADGPREVMQRHAAHRARVRGRSPAPRVVVTATRTGVTATPDPAALAPYRRALAAHAYTVDRVHAGELDAKAIAAAHWTVLDAERTADAAAEAGERVRLTLEPYDAHPQLESERLLMELDDLELPLYLVVESEPAE